MLQYGLRRAFTTLVVMAVVSVLVFSMTRMLPGDPARLIAGPMAEESVVAEIRTELGLDEPLIQQYARFVSGLLRGDLGRSIRTRTSVTDEILSRLPATFELAAIATLISGLLGIGLGLVAAVRKGRLLDEIVLTGSSAAMSIPHFWLGLVLLTYLAGRLGWFPVGGREGFGAVILPAITLAARPTALLARLTRGAMLDAVNESYVRTAFSKGLSTTRVWVRHALRNALIPAVTVLGLQFGTLLGGVIIVETVFVWPGLGRLLITAIEARDFPVIQGIVLFLAFVFAVANLLVDLLYARLDPRIAYRTQS